MGVIMEAVMIKGCIFDLDGTLVDSLKDLARDFDSCRASDLKKR